ncbi:MAG: DPP IV N-terminal domain-containing protein, partial [Mariprofundaceae bacterium]|nr:DPP IV N-terminal domain-containing protein [Mariprofundaceae bacterium]
MRFIYTCVLACGLCLSLESAAQAESLFGNNSDVKERDSAQLLTLETKENEMYPKVSPDGKYLLTLTMQGHDVSISRRAIQNGGYLNIVTDDIASFASFAWFHDQVTFSSSRTGMLSLWKKPANGKGLMRREIELTGHLQEITLLEDGSIIATRIAQGYKQKHGLSSDHFNNWDMGSVHSYIVHIFPDGSEKRLSSGSGASLSKDGQHLVFSIAMGKSQHLFMMDIDGSNLAQLTSGHVQDAQATWSADGKWIVFTSNRAGTVDTGVSYKNNWELWAISNEGTHLTRLTYNKAKDGAPSMADDGTVYFHSDRRIDKAILAEREVRGSATGFHIWT